MSEISSDMAGEAKGKDSQRNSPEFRKLVEAYLEGVRSAYSGGGGTEHSGRTALDILLRGCAELWDKDIQIQQEPEQVKGKAPDFKISRKGMVIGYVETKRLGIDCEEVARSEQIEKYKTLNKNILISNYHDFYWLGGEQSISLVRKEDLTQGLQKIKVEKLNADSIKDFSTRLFLFLDAAPDQIASVKELTKKLAMRCHYLRDALKDKFKIQEKDIDEQDAVFAIYKAFKVQISREITTDEFADVFAQTLGFSLFLARLNTEDDHIVIELANVKQHIPQSFPLIKELAGYLEKFQDNKYLGIKWIVEELMSIINNLDSGEIKKDLSSEHIRQKRLNLSEEDTLLFERDPFIYFYENFLSSYDEELRKKRGVYYTPAPAVNFIVRAIDDILKDKNIFSLRAGLANSSVTALDFACGTGTFLLETMKQIFINSDTNTKQKVLDEHICQHIYGFEFLIAPYTLAHLKLSQYLKDEGVPLKENQTLPVYLANTLDDFDSAQQASQANFAFEKILKEGKEAQEIKDKDVLVIMGNPPYSVNSMNLHSWINEKVEEYKFIEGKPLKEKNPKSLLDDYVKFIRFAEYKMEKSQKGIVGIITNHGFINNVTFRGMRYHLLKTFDQIYIYDLQGSSRRKIKPPKGIKDENIFKIKQGVAISFFIKKPGLEKKICYKNFWGSSKEKLKSFVFKKYKALEWKEIKPESPDYFFFDFNKKYEKKYNNFKKMDCIFLIRVTGITSHCDNFAFSFSESAMKKRVKDIKNETKNIFAIKEEYEIKNYYADRARALLAKTELNFNKWLKPCLYRIFDIRYCYYGPETMVRHRPTMLHMLKNNNNLGIITPRQTPSSLEWQHVGIANTIIECCAVSNRGSERNYLFPLYLCAPDEDINLPKRVKEVYGVTNPFAKKEIIENIHPEFRKEINEKYNEVFSAKQIFFYIYAILHSPHYREKYREFLRIDFPRIPFPDDKASFLALYKLGEDLKEAHLLEKIPNNSVAYKGEGDHKITKINFCEQKLYINPKQYFTSVEQEIWEFEIGGYQVLKKYLEEREGQKLSWEEIQHIKDIVASLTETRRLMGEIDPIAKKFI